MTAGGGPLGAGAASWAPAGHVAIAPGGRAPPPHLISQLQGMGYGHNRATRALQATGMSGMPPPPPPLLARA